MLYVAVLLVIVILALVYAHVVEPGLLTVKNYRIDFSDRRLRVSRQNKHEGGLKICFFSDLHAGPYFRKDRLDRVADKIRACAPDLILCGGDLVTEESDVHSESFKQELVSFFTSLTAVAPVAAVFGNHDAEDDVNHKLTVEIYRQSGVHLLKNDLYEAAGTPPVYGTEEGYFGEPTPVPDGFTGILLCHQPDLTPDLLEGGQAILALSGHTHRGQVSFAGLPLVKVNLGRRFTYGLYVFNEAQALIVTGGIGMVHLPFRFWARPEIVCLSVTYNASEKEPESSEKRT